MRNKDFVVTAQLPIEPAWTASDVRVSAEALRGVVDAVQISDNVDARPHIAPLAAACLAMQAGMDAVVQIGCRDRNRIALQSDLMGAAALGVTSLLLTRGEKLPASLKQRVRGVFDIGAQRLLATAQAIAANERLIAPPGFFLGSNVTVIEPPDDWAADGLDFKAGAGIKFVQTQACLDTELLQKYMAALVAKKALERISVIVQVPLLDSLEMLHDLHQGRRPLLVADATAARLKQSADPAAAAESLCIDVLRQVAAIPGVAGANILYRGDCAGVARVVKASGMPAL
jgi:methylenetetrahydrofolate reductase (NADPH)